MHTRLWIGIPAGLFLLIHRTAVSCCWKGNLDDDEISLGINGNGNNNDDGNGDDTNGGDDNGGDTNGLVAAGRYLPPDLGVTYVYRPTTVLDPFHYATADVTYRTISATTGTGVAFDRQDADKTRPVFDGLNFLGTELPDGSGWSNKWIDEEDRPGVILPATLTGVGQTWTFEQRYHQFEDFANPGDWYPWAICDFTLAAVEDATVLGTDYEDCIRVDGDLDWIHSGFTEELTLQLWYCPDVGLVRVQCRQAGVLVGQLDLVSRT